MKTRSPWLAAFSGHINKVNNELEQSILRGTADGFLDLKLTASIVRGAVSEIEKQQKEIDTITEQLDKRNNEIKKLNEPKQQGQ